MARLLVRNRRAGEIRSQTCKMRRPLTFRGSLLMLTRYAIRLCSLAVVACRSDAVAPSLSPVPLGPIIEQVRAVVARDSARWVDFRRDLHRHPELSGAEVETSRKVTAELRRLGFEVRTNVGGYGVVGILRGARPGPLVAYR